MKRPRLVVHHAIGLRHEGAWRTSEKQSSIFIHHGVVLFRALGRLVGAHAGAQRPQVPPLYWRRRRWHDRRHHHVAARGHQDAPPNQARPERHGARVQSKPLNPERPAHHLAQRECLWPLAWHHAQPPRCHSRARCLLWLLRQVQGPLQRPRLLGHRDQLWLGRGRRVHDCVRAQPDLCRQDPHAAHADARRAGQRRRAHEERLPDAAIGRRQDAALEPQRQRRIVCALADQVYTLQVLLDARSCDQHVQGGGRPRLLQRPLGVVLGRLGGGDPARALRRAEKPPRRTVQAPALLPRWPLQAHGRGRHVPARGRPDAHARPAHANRRVPRQVPRHVSEHRDHLQGRGHAWPLRRHAGAPHEDGPKRSDHVRRPRDGGRKLSVGATHYLTKFQALYYEDSGGRSGVASVTRRLVSTTGRPSTRRRHKQALTERPRASVGP